MKAQLKELLNGDYGQIGILWFDGEWEGTWTHERGKDLYSYVRSLQPNIIVNNRVDKGRGGMGGLSDQGFAGDYGTPEQEIPANGMPGTDWESCMTMNDTWGFHQNDHNWKSAQTLVRNLIDCASKGGNYLLNVGPTGLGEIPPPSVERLSRMGTWLKKNGESIYGTQAGPFPKTPEWGRATQRPGKLYLHIYEPKRSLDLPGLQAGVIGAYVLANHASVAVSRTSSGLKLSLPTVPASDLPTVVVLRVMGKPSVTEVPLGPDREGIFNLGAVDAGVQGAAHYEAGDKRSIGFWTNAKDQVYWDFNVPKAGRYDVTIEYSCEPASAGSTYSVAVGGDSLMGKVSATGSWSDFRTEPLGVMSLLPGKQRLSVTPTDMPHGAVMNLRSIRLTPTRQ
jgi:alpha-L-fucosidase